MLNLTHSPTVRRGEVGAPPGRVFSSRAPVMGSASRDRTRAEAAEALQGPRSPRTPLPRWQLVPKPACDACRPRPGPRHAPITPPGPLSAPGPGICDFKVHRLVTSPLPVSFSSFIGFSDCSRPQGVGWGRGGEGEGRHLGRKIQRGLISGTGCLAS